MNRQRSSWTKIVGACIVWCVTIFGALLLLHVGRVSYGLKDEHAQGRNIITRDFSNDEWGNQPVEKRCLFGNDNTACTCQDYNHPTPRDGHEGWRQAHEHNKNRLQINTRLVFYGDDLVENLNGVAYDKVIPNGTKISHFFRETFINDLTADSVAVGVTGDSVANLLWRLENGEMPDSLDTNVFWLMIGANDLRRDGCSEEATLFGILKVAKVIHDHFPSSVVVIQSLLPQSPSDEGDCVLDAPDHRPLAKAHQEAPLWPSIQAINQQLEKFCNGHEYFIYYDASDMFVERFQYRSKAGTRMGKRIDRRLMPDCYHLSPQGWNILGADILQAYYRIVLDEDESPSAYNRKDVLRDTTDKLLVSNLKKEEAYASK